MSYKTISTSELDSLLQNKNPIILDCRDTQNYRAGHIPNALHVHEGLTRSLIKSGDKQRCLLIYCYHGHNSQHLAEFFCQFGFNEVYSLDGGFTQWRQDQENNDD